MSKLGYSKSLRKAVRETLSRVRSTCPLVASTNAVRAELRKEVVNPLQHGVKVERILEMLVHTHEIKHAPVVVVQLRCNICGRFTRHIDGKCTSHESVYCTYCDRHTNRFDGKSCQHHRLDYCNQCRGSTVFFDGICENAHKHPSGINPYDGIWR